MSSSDGTHLMEIPMKYIDGFISAMLGPLKPTGHAIARGGCIALIMAIWMSCSFGSNMTVAHAGFLGTLTFIAAFGPELAYRAFELRKPVIGGLATAGAILMLVIQFGVDQSYTAGIRGKNRDETRAANVNYDGAQRQVSSEEANLLVLRKTLDAKIAERKALIEANPWAASIKPDGLKADLKNLEDKIASEIKGGRDGRKGGCARVCEGLKDQAADVAKRISAAEKASELANEIEKLGNEIKTIQSKVDTKVATASKTEYKSSAVAHSNKEIAKAFAFIGFGDISPSENVEQGTDIGINMAMALAATIVPAFCFLMAVALFRKEEDETIPHAIQRTASTVFETMTGDTHRLPAPSGHTIIERPTIVQDTKVAATLARLAQFRQQKAA